MNNVPTRASCDAIGRLLATITRRWTLHILWILISEGPTHFGALRRKVRGISARVLTVRLRALEAEGLVYRELTEACPPEAIYGLTKMAAEIGTLLEELHRVAIRWETDLSKCETLPDNKGQPASAPRFAREARD